MHLLSSCLPQSENASEEAGEGEYVNLYSSGQSSEELPHSRGVSNLRAASCMWPGLAGLGPASAWLSLLVPGRLGPAALPRATLARWGEDVAPRGGPPFAFSARVTLSGPGRMGLLEMRGGGIVLAWPRIGCCLRFLSTRLLVSRPVFHPLPRGRDSSLPHHQASWAFTPSSSLSALPYPHRNSF